LLAHKFNGAVRTNRLIPAGARHGIDNLTINPTMIPGMA